MYEISTSRVIRTHLEFSLIPGPKEHVEMAEDRALRLDEFKKHTLLIQTKSQTFILLCIVSAIVIPLRLHNTSSSPHYLSFGRGLSQQTCLCGPLLCLILDICFKCTVLRAPNMSWFRNRVLFWMTELFVPRTNTLLQGNGEKHIAITDRADGNPSH